jgi:hypothetical protein
MARISRSAKARAMREARQQRQGDYRPLACEACGADLHATFLSVTGSSLLCGDCDPSDDVYGAVEDSWDTGGPWGATGR